jgi:hypothetical protein
MKNAKKSDRISNELLETALALSKHSVLSAQNVTHPPCKSGNLKAQVNTQAVLRPSYFN